MVGVWLHPWACIVNEHFLTQDLLSWESFATTTTWLLDAVWYRKYLHKPMYLVQDFPSDKCESVETTAIEHGCRLITAVSLHCQFAFVNSRFVVVRELCNHCYFVFIFCSLHARNAELLWNQCYRAWFRVWAMKKTTLGGTGQRKANYSRRHYRRQPRVSDAQNQTAKKDQTELLGGFKFS